MQTNQFLNIRTPVIIVLLMFMLTSFSSCCIFLGLDCPDYKKGTKTNTGVAKKSGSKKEGQPVKAILSTMEAGVNVSFLTSDDKQAKYEPGAGFYFNAGSSWDIGSKWSINPSIGFSRINATVKQEYLTDPYPGTGEPVYTVERKNRYQYDALSLPVLAEYKMNKQLLIYAGPSLNYVVGAKMKTENSNYEANNIDNTERVGINLHVGLKYKFYSRDNVSKFGVRLGYDHGLTALSKNEPVYRMRGVKLGLSYNFCNCH